jgi:hypothetical protein
VQRDKGHGRIEVRKIQTSTALADYLDFPYAAQVFRIERTRLHIKTGKCEKETVYGITSLPEETGPGRLLELVRGHWRIENSLHWVRDVSFDEDRSQVRTGAGPRAMATMRNLAIGLLRLRGCVNIAQALRQHAWNPELAVSAIGA